MTDHAYPRLYVTVHDRTLLYACPCLLLNVNERPPMSIVSGFPWKEHPMKILVLTSNITWSALWTFWARVIDAGNRSNACNNEIDVILKFITHSSLNHMEYQMFSNCQCTNEHIILLDVCRNGGDVSSDFPTIDIYRSISNQSTTISWRNNIQQGRFSRTTGSENGLIHTQRITNLNNTWLPLTQQVDQDKQLQTLKRTSSMWKLCFAKLLITIFQNLFHILTRFRFSAVPFAFARNINV